MSDDSQSDDADTASAGLLRPELQSWALGSVLDVAEAQLGRARVEQWQREWGVNLRRLIQSRDWVAVEFVERLLGRMVDEGGEELVLRAGRESMAPKHMGPIYPFFRAFGSTLSTYERIVQSSKHFNKVHAIELERHAPGHVTLRFRWDAPRAPVSMCNVCMMNREQVASVPTLFDLPPAQVDHKTCFCTGSQDCVFDVQWRERQGRFPAWAALPVGAAVGVSVGWLTNPTLASAGVLGGVFATAAWAGMLAFRQRRELLERLEDIKEHRDALSRSVRENEERFEELLEAKADVDRQVEERTRELRETSEQLARTLEEVRNLDRAKTEFFSNVSHELRTPLTLLLAPLDELANGREPPGGTRAALRSMRQNAVRLRTLINQLLDLAKIDAGAVTLERAPLDLGALARSVAESFRPAAEQRGVRLEVEVGSHIVPLALDRSWIESALTNLVANAVRVMEGEGRVAIRVRDEGAAVRICVEDDGPGIAAESLDGIFERFGQTGDHKSRRGGTGLGLALVREAARLHGGDVAVASEPGQGATFTMKLPRVAAAVASEPLEERSGDAESPPIDARSELSAELQAMTEDASADESRDGPSPDAPLALVVEDNPDLRRFLADVLAARYAVKTATDGQQGLEMTRTLRPDVVVSDVRMRGLDGLELTRALRAEQETRAVPVLLVTALGDLGQILEGFEAGASDYITKPFQGRELLARADVHVRLRRMVQELAHHERLAMLGSVAASVAHEVRNPLTALVSGLPAMKQKLPSLDEPTREMFDLMIECAERIEKMTVDLLDLSRVNREQSGNFTPGAALMAAVRLTRARLSETVEVVTDVDEEAVVHGRAGDLNHVFLNLLDNAARAVGAVGRIRVEAKVDGGRYVVHVADSGPGIRGPARERVFDPFVTTRAAGEGTGLGLSVAREVMEEHHGAIAVGDAPEGGACFTLWLPCANAVPAHDQREVQRGA